jgi:hypothetical protein
VMKSYLTREREYGNTIGQGVGVELHYVDLLASYQVRHNMFVDLRLVARETDCEVGIFDDKTYFLSGSFRWNIPRVNHDF